MLTLLVAGSAWAQERARRVVEAHRAGQRAFQVVAGNRHDVYALAAAAKAEGLDPREVLKASILARAFTAHQLASLLEDTLPVMLADRLGFVAVTDPLDLYASDEVGREEGIALLQRGMAKLRLLAHRSPVPILVVQHPGAGSAAHWEALAAVADVRAVLPPPPARGGGQPSLEAWMPAEAPEVRVVGPHAAHVPAPA